MNMVIVQDYLQSRRNYGWRARKEFVTCPFGGVHPSRDLLYTIYSVMLFRIYNATSLLTGERISGKMLNLRTKNRTENGIIGRVI